MLPALWRLARRTPRVTLAVALGVALLGVMWLSGRSAPRGAATAPGNPLGEGRLLTPEVELRGVVRQLQEDTAVLRKSLDDVTRALQDLREKKGLAGDAALSAKELERLKRELGPLPPPPNPVATPAPPAPAAPIAPPPDLPRITVFTVGKPAPPPPAPPARWVHLPAGSFVKATLLSGVYAPTRAQQPLPVLLHFTEAPVGPNATRVPLRGCIAVARALGDYTTKRAGLQLDTMSCVLPSGRAVSQAVTGWVAGPDGVFGMPGELVEREGPYLARVSLAGFLHGASAAFAAAQTTTSIGALGNTTTTITGNEALYGALSGFANSANRMAAFYERQLESLVPAVYVPSGLTGSAVIQGGVTLDGVELDHLLAHTGGASWHGLD
jgi:Bacterial conjugation TrbI-like protein